MAETNKQTKTQLVTIIHSQHKHTLLYLLSINNVTNVELDSEAVVIGVLTWICLLLCLCCSRLLPSCYTASLFAKLNDSHQILNSLLGVVCDLVDSVLVDHLLFIW